VEITVTQHDGYTLAATSGPLDDSTPPVFREQLHPLFNERGVRLVVDIAGSPRISSDGLTAMVRLVSDANTRGGRVVFAAPAPFVSEIFRITRLEKFFEIAPSTGAAVDAVGAPASP
jgi:anti-anti-sigma factor